MKTLSEHLEDARAEVARIEKAMLTATCKEAGCDMQCIGGANAGCGPDCCCSVPVLTCTRCGDSDYGKNDDADDVRRRCAEGFPQ